MTKQQTPTFISDVNERLQQAFDKQRRTISTDTRIFGIGNGRSRDGSNPYQINDNSGEVKTLHQQKEHHTHDIPIILVFAIVFTSLVAIVMLVSAIRKFNNIKHSNTRLINKLGSLHVETPGSCYRIDQNGKTLGNSDTSTAKNQTILKFFEDVEEDMANDAIELNTDSNLLLPIPPPVPASTIIDFVIIKSGKIASDMAQISAMINGQPLQNYEPHEKNEPKKTQKNGSNLSLLQISDIQTRLNSCEYLIDLIESLLPPSLAIKYCNLRTEGIRGSIANQRAYLQKICRNRSNNVRNREAHNTQL